MPTLFGTTVLQRPFRWYLPVLLFASAFLGTTAGAVEAAQPADGVLLSDSFEAGNETPEHWEQGPPVPSVRYLWSCGKVPDGKRALSLKKTVNRYVPIAAWTRVLEHRGEQAELDVTVQVKARRTTKATVDVQFLDASGQWSHEWACYIGAKESKDPPLTHDWKEYHGKIAIPPGTEKFAIALQIYGPGQVWFDQLELSYADQSAEAPTTSSERPHNSDGLIEGNTFAVDVKDGARGDYLLVEPSGEAPQKGWGLVVVLPGGDGSADFHPFVRRIQEVALEDSYLVAQPVAKKWTVHQQIVWPTRTHPAPGMKFSTEELLTSVVDDIGQRHRLDRGRVYLLAWSSGGPAAYAALMDEKSPIAGALVAMSVYKPDTLPDIAGSKEKRFYLLHSKDDHVCPYHMAEAAVRDLGRAGALVTLVTYEGGHGWHGDVFGNIRRGIQWLDKEE